ncbi:MAG: 16S rRNA (adenine(1518)-N(6)/adenine(1519)-N(6))-dimethyltransferase RsmA [Waddliaceae bacterium]
MDIDPRYCPTRLRKFLQELKQTPKKSLSQNFLIDGNVIKKILAAASVKKGDLVLEIGPGPGALTQGLIEIGAEVIAVEKDRAFARALQNDFKTLTVYEDDILQFSLDAVPRKCKVISNLPYNLTTPILKKLLPRVDLFSQLILMVQKEVALRICESPGHKNFGPLALLAQFYSNPRYLFTVKQNCFYPAPKVDSAIIALDSRTPPHVSDEKAFFEMVRNCFNQRRKMLRRTLPALFPKSNTEEIFKAIQIKSTARPEELSLEQFIALFEELTK